MKDKEKLEAIKKLVTGIHNKCTSLLEESEEIEVLDDDQLIDIAGWEGSTFVTNQILEILNK